HVSNENLIKGLPEQALQLAIANAKQRNLDGYVFTLEYPSYSTAIRFLETRELRKNLYEAFVTRASDRGPNANTWYNAPIINDILKARNELANLIGFKNFSEYSLATIMAKSRHNVMHFLHYLLIRSI